MEAEGTNRVAVLIFLRLPVEGKVKTRLAAGAGDAAACSIYKACAEHIVCEAHRCLSRPSHVRAWSAPGESPLISCSKLLCAMPPSSRPAPFFYMVRPALTAGCLQVGLHSAVLLLRGNRGGCRAPVAPAERSGEYQTELHDCA
jgi:hypothetical protein